MRIRIPFAVAFFAACAISAYLGFSSVQVPVNDKLLHVVTFFILTVCFYWILDATRRRVVNLTLGICTLIGGIGSEFVQDLVTKRAFDPLDILSNIIGSAAGLLLCTWYHRRMLERKRLAKNPYQPVSGDDDVEFDQGAEELRDLESAGGPSGSTADGDTNRIKSKD